MTLDLNKCWTEHDICVMDTETVGLEPSDGVCDVAAVRFRRGEVVDQFTSLVDPERPIPAEATAIHGITDADVRGKPSLWWLAPDLYRVAGGAVPCAYSADFDRNMIRYAISGAGCEAFDPAFEQWLDPLIVVRKVDRFQSGKGRHRLEAACARRGIAIDGAHRALPDAIATGRLLFEMLKRGEIKPCPLGKLLEYMGKLKREQEAAFMEWLLAQQEQDKFREISK